MLADDAALPQALPVCRGQVGEGADLVRFSRREFSSFSSFSSFKKMLQKYRFGYTLIFYFKKNGTKKKKIVF